MMSMRDAERDSELLLSSLKEYLLGEEWRQNIDAFVSSNCYRFKGARREHSHEHHEVWKTFQEIVEQILEMALADVGGSVSKLERALEKIAAQPARGPREAATKEVLERLLSFGSFAAFAQMMSDAAAATNAQPPVEAPRCGSNRRSLREKHFANLTALGFFEEMIEVVMEHADENASLEDLVMTLSELQAHGSAATVAAKRASCPREKYETPSKETTSSPDKGKQQYTGRFPHIESFADEILSDAMDCYSKFVMAKSIQDTFHAGDTSGDIVSMLDWSNDMLELLGAIEAAYQEGIAFADMRHQHSEGLVAWFRELERTRQALDAEQASGHLLSDAELRRIADLNRIAAMGTEDEQYLHSLITRHDEVQKQVDSLHLTCRSMVSADVIKREKLEELYLYLKEKVASGADLEALTDEMHDKVYSACSSARGAEIVNVLLDMHILEDEQAMLRLKINSILGSPGRAEDKDSYDGSVCGGKDSNDDFKDDSKAPERADAKAPSLEQARDGNKDRLGLESSAAPSDFLDSLKRKHRTGLQSLKTSLEAERSRRLRALEARLQGRQRSAAEAEEAAAQAMKFEQLQEGVISGYKKRCMHEMDSARKKGAELTVEEEARCHRDAADALKERYLRDNKQLLESLEQERVRQQQHLLAQLKERSKLSRSLTDERRLLEQFKAEVESRDKAFDEDALEAMAASQTKILLNLATIFADEDTLRSSSERSTDEDDFDNYLEDSGGQGSQGLARWLQDSEGIADAYASAGLELQRRVQGAHRSESGYALMDDSIVIEELQAEPEGSSALPVLSHMATVIMDAFMHQIKTPGSDFSDAKDSILREFEKARSAYAEAVLQSQQDGKSKLAARRDQRRGDPAGGVAAVVDAFLRDPMSLQYAPPSKAGVVLPALPYPRPLAPVVGLNGKRALAPLHGSNEGFDEDQWLNNGNKDRLLSQYKDKERKLVSDLEDQMLVKRRALEERLQQKKEAAAKARGAAAEHKKDLRDFLQEEGDAEVAATQAELRALQSAFDRVVDYVRHSDDTDLANLDAAALAKAMAQMMREEPAEGAPAGADPLERAAEDRILMQAEVKRVTEVYNEEKQKHDLIMKMQQTRQRQMLQRKLLERRTVVGKGSSAGAADELELSFSQPRTLTQQAPARGLDGGVGRVVPLDGGMASRGLHLSPMLRK